MGEGQWTLQSSAEVDSWLAGLQPNDRGRAQKAISRLVELGPHLRMPYTRQLATGLWELRFRCAYANQRITFTITEEGVIVLFTRFRKQRKNERGEFLRARNQLIRHQRSHR